MMIPIGSVCSTVSEFFFIAASFGFSLSVRRAWRLKAVAVPFWSKIVKRYAAYTWWNRAVGSAYDVSQNRTPKRDTVCLIDTGLGHRCPVTGSRRPRPDLGDCLPSQKGLSVLEY